MEHKFKGTPGPWRTDDNGGCKDIRSETTGLATCFTHGLYKDPVDLANANLISAAPEMFEELEYLYRIIISQDGTVSLNDNEIESIQKVLGKATGISC